MDMRPLFINCGDKLVSKVASVKYLKITLPEPIWITIVLSPNLVLNNLEKMVSSVARISVRFRGS